LMLWTENGIRRVANEVLTGQSGKDIIVQQVTTVLNERVHAQKASEIKTQIDEFLARHKSALTKALAKVFEAQTNRLESKLLELSAEIDKKAPDHIKKLKYLDDELSRINTESVTWLDKASEDLDDLLDEELKSFQIIIKKFLAERFEDTEKFYRVAENRLIEKVDKHLDRMLVESVKQHVRSSMFEEENLSNMQLAAIKGISLRAAKRLRRASP
jgi:hypothetical protein